MLEIIRAGLFDTIQDLGRFGLRSLGVAVSGAMHKKAFAQANARLGNHPNDAALEIGQIGGVYRFHTPTFFYPPLAQPKKLDLMVWLFQLARFIGPRRVMSFL